jgi:hypothetical protein
LASFLAYPLNAAAQIYVAYGGTTIGEFTLSGNLVNANLVTGLHDPIGVALYNGNLYVANGKNIGEYDATTGAVINPSFITGLQAAWRLRRRLADQRGWRSRSTGLMFAALGFAALVAWRLRRRWRFGPVRDAAASGFLGEFTARG